MRTEQPPTPGEASLRAGELGLEARQWIEAFRDKGQTVEESFQAWLEARFTGPVLPVVAGIIRHQIFPPAPKATAGGPITRPVHPAFLKRDAEGGAKTLAGLAEKMDMNKAAPITPPFKPVREEDIPEPAAPRDADAWEDSGADRDL